ncbi:MAG: hypothetical protein ACPG5B_05115 [Chitinophagales bacterium]
MKEKEIFKYQKRKKIEDIILTILIIIAISFTLTTDESITTKIILTIILVIFLFFMVKDACWLNENIELSSESININQKIGKSSKIHYDEIRRITIREEVNSVEANHFALTIFGKKTNNRVIISDLDNRFKMIRLLEEKGKTHNFNVIHQNIDGKVIKSLKKEKRNL